MIYNQEVEETIVNRFFPNLESMQHDSYILSLVKGENTITIYRNGTISNHDSKEYGDEPKITYVADDKNSLEKSMLFLKIHIKKFSQMKFDFHDRTVTYQYSLDYSPHSLKKSRLEKRLRSHIALVDLKNALFNIHGGYVLREKEGSVAVANRKFFTIQGFGFEYHTSTAVRKALMEYIERYSSVLKLPGTINGSYEELQKENSLVNPEKFGFYKPSLSKEKYNLTPFTKSLHIDWVPAVSLVNHDVRYVPEQLVQYLKPDIENKFMIESSNGCAVGNSVEEASLFSVLEAYERDIFFKTWFSNDSVIKIEQVKQYENQELYFLSEGYLLEFYLLENEANIPVVWGLIRSIHPQNDIYSITGLGCHTQLEQAIESAFTELYNAYKNLKSLENSSLTSLIKEVENKDKLENIQDHFYLFASYKIQPLLDKKISNRKREKYSKLLDMSFYEQCIKNELDYVIKKITPQYEDILQIKQSNRLLSSLSLSCTKVLLIGSIPVDFTTDLVRFNHSKYDIARLEGKNIHPLA
ncbi:YcaO-like family protein [Sutcliffiella rhizosphaerae]|uniref:YcaO domain-containing protein n=1 Tax=Sutcliffiella rhizosphaerae TaxID=2880967 RepID=A0ABM8YMK2_9BACI|nr:YcaO-like family protein [Sutcliffiella rhizosphaerae]CAG9621196.1 hypothetical protein BACCIP111883_01968 [Sutcliffiella rhizosphaerae]